MIGVANKKNGRRRALQNNIRQYYTNVRLARSGWPLYQSNPGAKASATA